MENRPKRRSSPALLLTCLLSLAASGCASRYKLDAEPPAYAAKAKIKVKVNKTENREMTVRIDHLAPPSRIGPNLRGYVVWIHVPGHGTSKAGLLDYNERRRRGTLKATTPHPKFEVIVTLEDDLSVAQPSERVIVRKLVAKA
ncbi:MAG: hypothetical protein AAF799_45250 [Myxococcota bacterium]